MNLNFRLALVCFVIIIGEIEFLSAQSSDAVCTNFQTELVVKNKKLIINRTYEIVINNRAGEKYATVSIPYSKLGKLSKLQAYLKDKNGEVIRKLKSSDITDRSLMADFSLFEDNYLKEFTLVHNVYPYSVCYSYQQQQESFLELEDWSPVLDFDMATQYASLKLDVPVDYPIRYLSNLTDSFNVDTLASTIKYKWVASYKKELFPEIFAPNRSIFAPRVAIVPLAFNFEIAGSFETWTNFGNWHNSLLEPLDDLPDYEKLKIQALVNGINDENEKVKILYHYLQDVTRYINVTIFTGGLKPYPASYVAANKYGDCKALANYFKSVLNYVGIKSIYTKVYAGEVIRKINKAFPSQQFNHIILCVPMPKDTLWLDCTSDGPFNRLGTFTQNRDVFLVGKDCSRFAHTPELKVDEVLDVRNIRIQQDSTQVFMANFRSKYRGENYENLFAISHSASESRRSQIIRNNFINSDFDLLQYKLIPAHRDSSFIVLTYKAKADKLLNKYGTESLFKMVSFPLPLFTDPQKRKFPVQLNFPINKLDTLEYIIPKGFRVANVPENKEIKSEYGEYHLNIMQDDDTIRIVKNFVLRAGEYDLDRYKSFYEFFSQVFGIENNSYIILQNN